MTTELSVYHYSNPRQYLLDFLNRRKQENSGFSVRSFAKEMGLKSHTLLVMLLQGKRPLRVKHASFLAKGLGLSSQERLYLQALIQFDSAPDQEEKELCRLWLSELHPNKEFKVKELDEFAVVSHWVHMAIMAMTQLKSFRGTTEEVHKRLGGKVTIHETRAALERLMSLGLLARTAKGKLEPTYQRVTTKDDVANVGARKYHQGVAQLAAEAVENVAMDRREFQSFSLAVKHDEIPLAKEMIRKFRHQFSKAIGSQDADEVYQMNIQFFQLTESPEPKRKAKTPEDEGVDTEWNNQNHAETSQETYHA